MLKLNKNIVLWAFLAIVISGCSSPIEDKEVVVKPNIVHSSKEYITVREPLPIKTKKYNSPVKINKKPSQAKGIADLRGVVSDDVFSQLEETQAVNPIRGYSSVKSGDLKKVKKESKEPAFKTEEKKVQKPSSSTKKPGTKPSRKFAINEDNLIGLSGKNILKVLKEPNKKNESKQVSIWAYKNNTCWVNLYFYDNKCAHIESGFNEPDYQNMDSCLKTFAK